MNADDPIQKFFRLNPAQSRALERLGLEKIGDLIFYFPSRYGNTRPTRLIQELTADEEATVYGQVVNAKISKAWKKKIPMGEVVVEDATGRIKAVWFHQAFLAKKVPIGETARISGKVTERKGELYFANPEIEATRHGIESLFEGNGVEEGGLEPIYPESRGLSSLWFRHAIQKIIKNDLANHLPDPIPTEILKRYNLPSLASSLVWIHSPRTAKDAEAARKRFAFQEIFLIQLSRQQTKQEYTKHGSFQIKAEQKLIDDFVARFPFQPTQAQKRAIQNILTDFQSDKPMMRLLEGDVGSGKTAVAAATAFAVVRSGQQVAYMVPTEILARQHFESFIQYFKHLPGVQVGLLTGAGCYKFPSKINPSGFTNISRSQLLKWVANGEIPILVGTHALIQKTVRFKNLAYAIIDEQHRFGVKQRAGLLSRERNGGKAPHLLSMTATPIPRTLALTIYGDLDLTLLDELPAGRRQIVTQIVDEANREAAYAQIRQELAKGRQVYIICPRIDEPDPTKELALQVKSAKAEQKLLQEKIFPDFRIGLVHSKLKPGDKETAMKDFADGHTQILVATSVVEVGVNVPNATIIVIEGAERFGLAQLHQLRGRVLRSSHQAYCFLFTSKGTGRNNERLKALKTAKNGFELAELDLALRGTGSLSGTKQWGLSDLGMEAIKNIKMVEVARHEAQELISQDPALKNHPLLHTKLTVSQQGIHFE